MIKQVILSRYVQKQLYGLPAHIRKKLLSWVEDIESDGIEEVRKVIGLHDEPLKGSRKGERSIRLSRGYRAIYRITEDLIPIILVEEVTKHGY